MLKKSLAIGLSVVMAAEVLTGCSGGSGTTETKAADTGKTEAAASEAATEGGSGEEKTLTVSHSYPQLWHLENSLILSWVTRLPIRI